MIIIFIFMKKSLILINTLKKNRLAAGPLPGDSLSGGQSPTARCAGAKLCRKNIIALKSIFLHPWRVAWIQYKKKKLKFRPPVRFQKWNHRPPNPSGLKSIPPPVSPDTKQYPLHPLPIPVPPTGWQVWCKLVFLCAVCCVDSIIESLVDVLVGYALVTATVWCGRRWFSLFSTVYTIADAYMIEPTWIVIHDW